MENDPSPEPFVVNNPEQLVQFYKNVWGWEVLVRNDRIGEWTVVAHQANPNYPPEGIRIVRQTANSGTSFLFNFETDSIEGITERVKANGGRVYLEGQEGLGPESGLPGVMDLPGIGRQIFFCDPEGNMFGAVEFFYNPAA